MPSHNYRIQTTHDSRTYLKELQDKTWEVSPRDKHGNLLLRSNSYKLRKQIWFFTGNGAECSYGYEAGGSLRVIEASEVNSVVASLQNKAYGRIRGRLYKGNAALGVTLGSYKQSREMVVSRYQQLNRKADEALARLGQVPQKGLGKAIANTHLEVIFGWTPLLADIQAATRTVIQNAHPDFQFVRGRGKGFIQTQSSSSNVSRKINRKTNGVATVTIATGVRIDNPNLWLLERAGLLNVGSVAWDLVPWSFVVNMFVNTGSIVNSVTDFAGLRFIDTSTTTTTRLMRTVTSQHRSSGKTGTTFSLETTKLRQKTMSLPPPSLEFRIPDAKWETAAMAASLFTQKLSAINRVFRSARQFINTKPP